MNHIKVVIERNFKDGLWRWEILADGSFVDPVHASSVGLASYVEAAENAAKHLENCEA